MILGADTRATEGPIVCDKNCEKIHYMAPNIYCCGAGTAADTEAVTGIYIDQTLNLIVVLACSGSLSSSLCCGLLIFLANARLFDVLFFPDMVSSQLQLHRYHTGRESRVVTALTLLKRHLFR